MSFQAMPHFNALAQPAKGYRYGIDTFLLGRFARFLPQDRVCDLGAGVGTLALLSLCREKTAKAVAVEVQEFLAEYTLKNAETLGVKDRLEVLCANWQQVARHFKPKSFQVVVSNPPYWRAGAGKMPPEKSKAIAKHELEGTMADLVKAAAYLLKPTGRFYLMYPPLRLEEMLAELHRTKFKVQRMAVIHPYVDRPATLVMVEAVRSPVREMILEAPVIVYRDPDHYTSEVEAWVGPKRKV